MHHVLNQTFDAANLRDHERRVFRFDTENNAHFQLHRETIFRDHLEWVERVGNFTRGPFDRLVRRRNDDWRDCEGVDVITAWANYGFLNTAIPFGNDVSLMSAFVETTIRGIAHHQVALDLVGSALVVHDVETRGRFRDLLLFFAFHALANFRRHLFAHFF